MNSRYFKLYRAYSNSFNSSNLGKFFWSSILKDCIKVQEKKKKVVLLFASSAKRELRHFHVVVLQRRLRNVQKSGMHVQSCCVANLNQLLFCRSRCRRRRRSLSSLLSLSLRGLFKMMLHETIRKTIFSATQRCNVGTMLQPFQAMLQQCCNAVLR